MTLTLKNDVTTDMKTKHANSHSDTATTINCSRMECKKEANADFRCTVNQDGNCGIRPSSCTGPYPGHPCESLGSWDDWLAPVGT